MAPRDEAAELIAEARAEARAAVKARLREEYERELLAQARELLEPPPAAAPEPAGEAWWVYCIVRPGGELPDGLQGVTSAAPAVISAGGLAAVASRVPLAEFGEHALRENLNDLGWLERVARAHDGVLEELLPRGPVVPLRVCTIYTDEAQIAAMLEGRSADLDAALDRLDGKAEWGVKVIADHDRIAERARGASEATQALAAQVDSGPEGGAYLARKKLAAAVRDEADRLIADALREAHAQLGEWACASVLLPAQNRELSGHAGEMVLNAAYLVDAERAEPFVALVEELDARSPGLAFQVTGPWPAYNFAGAPAEVRS
jgi:hypothetical protein